MVSKADDREKMIGKVSAKAETTRPTGRAGRYDCSLPTAKMF